MDDFTLIKARDPETGAIGSLAVFGRVLRDSDIESAKAALAPYLSEMDAPEPHCPECGARITLAESK